MNLLLWRLLQIKFFLHSSYYLLISLLLLLRELDRDNLLVSEGRVEVQVLIELALGDGELE